MPFKPGNTDGHHGNHHSGRKPKKPTVPPIKIPSVGTSEKSILRYLGAIARATAADQLAASAAVALTGMARTALSAIKGHHDRSEIDELRAMVRAAQDSVRAGIAHEVADRQHAPEAVSSAKIGADAPDPGAAAANSLGKSLH
jgi:hypothetical protein